MPVVALAQFSYTNNDGALTITGYTGPAGAVTIPSTIDGLPVTSIGEGAFWKSSAHQYVTSLTIPDSVTNIGKSAFVYCQNLTSVNLGNSLVNIGPGAFYCSGITNMTLPGSLTTIGEYAFSTCSSLVEIFVAKSVTNIGPQAFIYCQNLRAITVDADNPAYTSAEGVLFDKNQTELIQVPCAKAGSYSIPESVVSIGNLALYWCPSLTSVTIPASVTSVGDQSFRYCPQLQALYFSGNAPTVGLRVFDDSDAVTVYYLPGTTGWSATFGGRPTAPWVLPGPLILTTGPSLGVTNSIFGFIVSWASNASVVVEASADLASPSWSPISTNTLTAGSWSFSDPDWAMYPQRVYRLRWP